MDDIYKDLEIIKKGTDMDKEAALDGDKKKHPKEKKTERSNKKVKAGTSPDEMTVASKTPVVAKKRAKTMSPGQIKSDLKGRSKSRKSVGTVKNSPSLGKIKLLKKQEPKKPDKKVTESKESKPQKKEKDKPVDSKPASPAVRVKGSIDPNAKPIVGIRFDEGAKIEAVDSGHWYKARIVKVDQENMDILVHFDGWGARFDTWFPMTSTLIRGRTQLDSKRDMPVYSAGEDVLAKWSDGNFYPATVMNVKDSGSCLVMYFDGMKKLLRPNMIKKMSESEKETAMKAVEKLFLAPPAESSSEGEKFAAAISYRRYRTSADDRGKRVASRTEKPSEEASITDKALGKKAYKRKASQISTADDKSTIEVSPSNKTEIQSSGDDRFNAKKARLDKITHSLLDRVSPTADRERKNEIDIDKVKEEMNEDSDNPLVIDEEPHSKLIKKRKLKQTKPNKDTEGARGPRGGHVSKTSKTNISLAKKLQNEEKAQGIAEERYFMKKHIEPRMSCRVTDNCDSINHRKSYSAAFKLQVIEYAKQNNNNAAGRRFSVNEKQVRDWRQQEKQLKQTKETRKAFRGNKAKWPELENTLEYWILEQRAMCQDVNAREIRLKAVDLANEQEIKDFQGSASWCIRFLKRKNIPIQGRPTMCENYKCNKKTR